MAAALPFAAVLAGRLLAGRLISARLVPVAAAVLLGYVLTLGSNALARPAPSEDHRLARFLAGHHLRYGLSGYWQASADAGQREPGPDQGAAVTPGTFAPATGSRTLPGTSRGADANFSAVRREARSPARPA